MPPQKTLTETEQKMFDALCSGKPVKKEILKSLTPEGKEYCSDVNLQNHITRLRKKLEVIDSSLDIMAVRTFKSSSSYRLVRKLNNPYSGRN